MIWGKKRGKQDQKPAQETATAVEATRETPKNTLRIEELEERVQVGVLWGA